jgi:hypothetical protein
MGFGGGGGAALPNHQHTNIPLTGGPLDFSNVTIASLAASSMTFSDGAALQELPIGGAGDFLQVSAGVPAWAPTVSTAAWSFIEEFTLGVANANWTITPTTPLDLSEYQEFNIQIMFNHITTIGDLNVRINGDDQASYFMEGIKVFETTVTGLQEQNATEATLVPNTPANHTIRLEISWIGNQFNTGRQVARYWCMAGDETVISGIFCLSDAITDITSLEIRMGGGSIEAGARARLYRLAGS